MIRVLLAEDMHLVRGALVALLGFESDIEVVAELERGDHIVAAALAVRPHVAVIDIAMPGVDGITAASELHEKLPDCRTLILTGLTQAGNVRRAVQARVSGFVRKDAPPAELAEAIRRVASGLRVFDPLAALAALDMSESPLTPRELEILRIAAEGSSAREIAARLYLSVGTVRNYLSAVLTKVGARNRVDAIRIARDAGWM